MSILLPRPSARDRWLRDNPTMVRAGVAGVLALCYYQLTWLWLRGLLRSCTAWVLGEMGHEIHLLSSRGELLLSVDGSVFSFTANCTYAALILIVIPFCWRLSLSWQQNLLRLGALALFIEAANVARITLSLHLHTRGFSWRLVHDVPHAAFHYTILGIAFLLALRADRGMRCRSVHVGNLHQ